MNRFSALAAVAILAPLSFSLLACGYALVGQGSSLPDDVRRVYLSPLENSTQRSQVGQFLTRAIAEELVTRQRFRVADNADEADAELSGEVVRFAVNPVAFDSEGRATEYEIQITAKMSFRRPGSDEVLWSNDRYLFRENYEVEVSEEAYFDREDEAIENASERFAETMVSDLLEGF